MMRLLLAVISLLICLEAHAAAPVASCHGQMFVDAIANICLDCFFPITIGNTTVISGKLPDTDNPGNPICECGTFPDIHIGVAMGYWEPVGLIDVTRTPYCMVNLGGMQFASNPEAEGDVDTQSPDQHSGFYYVHYYNFPIISLFFDDLLGGSCQADGDFKIPYFSELDPTWHNETAANVIFSESGAFANPVAAMSAQGSCAIDSVKAQFGLALDSLFYCAGGQGFMYPLTGEVAEDNNLSQASTLIAERAIFKLHHLFLISDTSPDDLCEAHHNYMMKKSRYRYQMLYPSQKDCEPFGRGTELWSAHIDPAQFINGDDAAFMIWRKRNCCSW